MFADGLLNGARILVTGGGSGLGRMISAHCADLGAKVYLCGRREATLVEAASAIGPNAVPIACDIRSADQVDAMMDRIWSDGGPLTGLVNNAAGNFIAKTEDLSMRAFDAIADIVFRGTFQVTSACGRRWLAKEDPGAVVSILATWIWNGSPFAVPSSMSKAGVHAMTQSLAVEWGGRGIRLNAICPGAFESEGASARLDPLGDSDLFTNPMQRRGRPEELGNLVVFLLAQGAGFVNGQTIAIDGAGWQANGQNFSGLANWSDAQWDAARTSSREIDRRDRTQRSVDTGGRD